MKIFKEMDADGTGEIDFKELNDFIQMIAEPIGMDSHSTQDV